jgi:hypothetical protein
LIPVQGCRRVSKKRNRGKGTHRSSSGGDEASESVQKEDPISQQCCGEKGRRRRRRRRCRASLSVSAGVEQVDGGVGSTFLRPAMERKGQRGRGRRRLCGGKKSKFTPTPVFIPRDQGRGDRGKCTTTPTVSAGGRHVSARSGAAVSVTVP